MDAVEVVEVVRSRVENRDARGSNCHVEFGTSRFPYNRPWGKTDIAHAGIVAVAQQRADLDYGWLPAYASNEEVPLKGDLPKRGRVRSMQSFYMEADAGDAQTRHLRRCHREPEEAQWP